MQVINTDKIDPWDVRKEPRGTVFVVNDLTIDRGRSDRFLLASCIVDSPIDPAGVMITITPHHHAGTWRLVTEYESAQKATTFELGHLADVTEWFAKAARIDKFPPLKVIEPGIGVYDAASRYASDNPWALKNGELYEFTRTNGHRQQWMASVRNGRTYVTRADSDNHMYETFDPAILFSANEWKSMRMVPENPKEEATEPVARRRPMGPR